MSKQTEFKRGFFFYYTSMVNSVANLFVNHILGNFSIKTFALKIKNQMPVGEGAYSVVLEHVFNVIVFVIAMLPAAAYFLRFISVNPTLIITGILLCICMFNIRFFFTIYIWMISMTVRIFSRLFKRGNAKNTISSAQHYMFMKKDEQVKHAARRIYLYTVVIFYLHVISNYFYAYALDIKIDFGEFVVAFPLMYAIAIFNVTPSSLGIREIGWYGILTYMGIKNTDASTYVVGNRTVAIGAYLCIFFISFVVYHWPTSKNKSIDAEEGAKIV